MADEIDRSGRSRVRWAERAAQSFSRILGRVLRRIDQVLSRHLLLTPPPLGSVARGVYIAGLRREIQQAFRESGFQRLAGAAYGPMVEGLVREVLSRPAGTDIVLATIRTRLEAIRRVAEANLLAEGARVENALWQAVTRGIFAGRPVERLLDDLALVLDKSEAQIATLYDTSVSIYGRQIEALTATPGEDTLFRYVGPDDEVTRPFCVVRIGKVFQRAEIDAMDNGQLPDVFLTGGGYNCRHSWIEVTRIDLEDQAST